jgi:hypothetical protein
MQFSATTRVSVKQSIREGQIVTAQDVYSVPQIGVSISDSQLGIILLNAVQKMSYDCNTDD